MIAVYAGSLRVGAASDARGAVRLVAALARRLAHPAAGARLRCKVTPRGFRVTLARN